MGLTIGFSPLASCIAFSDGGFPLAALRRYRAIDGCLLAIGDGAAITTASDVGDRDKRDEEQDAARDGDDTATAHASLTESAGPAASRTGNPITGSPAGQRRAMQRALAMRVIVTASLWLPPRT